MTSEIVLLPVDAPVPEDETPRTAPETQDDVIPTKRGRGRPPGAKNKPKTEPVEARKKRQSPPIQEEEEEEEPTPPLPVKRKAKTRPAPPLSESEEEPPSPRAQRRQTQADVLTRRRNHHQERVQNYSTLLDGMLAY